MVEYITGLAAPVLYWLAVLSWFLILVGSVGLVAAVYIVRDWWRQRGR